MQREIRKILSHLELLLWCCFLHETDGGKRRKEAGTGGEKKENQFRKLSWRARWRLVGFYSAHTSRTTAFYVRQAKCIFSHQWHHPLVGVTIWFHSLRKQTRTFYLARPWWQTGMHLMDGNSVFSFGGIRALVLGDTMGGEVHVIPGNDGMRLLEPLVAAWAGAPGQSCRCWREQELAQICTGSTCAGKEPK